MAGLESLSYCHNDWQDAIYEILEFDIESQNMMPFLLCCCASAWPLLWSGYDRDSHQLVVVSLLSCYQSQELWEATKHFKIQVPDPQYFLTEKRWKKRLSFAAECSSLGKLHSMQLLSCMKSLHLPNLYYQVNKWGEERFHFFQPFNGKKFSHFAIQAKFK